MVIRSKKGIHVLRNAQQFKPIQWPSQPIEEEEKGVWSELSLIHISEPTRRS